MIRNAPAAVWCSRPMIRSARRMRGRTAGAHRSWSMAGAERAHSVCNGLRALAARAARRRLGAGARCGAAGLERSRSATAAAGTGPPMRSARCWRRRSPIRSSARRTAAARRGVRRCARDTVARGAVAGTDAADVSLRAAARRARTAQSPRAARPPMRRRRWSGRGTRRCWSQAQDSNLKITTAADLRSPQAILRQQGSCHESRLRHRRARLRSRRCVMLGGVRIAHSRGVVAHSDGDVLLHALVRCAAGRRGPGRHRAAFSRQRSAVERRRQRALRGAPRWQLLERAGPARA